MKTTRILSMALGALLVLFVGLSPAPPLGSQGAVQTLSSHLIDSAQATGDGAWINVDGFTNITVHVSGITTATVILGISNNILQPADSDNEVAASTITSDDIVFVSGPVRWIKARVSAYTTGTIDVWLKANK